jgi:hypothetical protein
MGGGDAAPNLGLARAQPAKKVALFRVVEAIMEERKALFQAISGISPTCREVTRSK